MKNYTLNKIQAKGPDAANAKDAQKGVLAPVKKLWPLLKEERLNLFFAFVAIIINSSVNLSSPLIVAHVIDTYVPNKDYRGILLFAGILLVMFLMGLVASYLQTQWMGGIGQRMLFKLRNLVFNKLQQLPVAFFNQNKAGDLISRINNDTDKLNQFFSQYLMQFIMSIVVMIGAGIFLLSINFELGAITLLPALILVIFTRAVSGWVKRKNAVNMQALGGMSSEIQESLEHFKVIVAFNRRDYFRERFQKSNQENYNSAVSAGLANNVFTPIYQLSSNIAQLVVLVFGIYMIAAGNFTVGLLISFFSYVSSFYNPLRQLAALWASFQMAMAGWDRIAQILAMESDLVKIPAKEPAVGDAVLEFRNVRFGYQEDDSDTSKDVLSNINFRLEAGKTYALVGPTGGGKTTTASLMARLYDPTHGRIYLRGKDIRSYDDAQRTAKIGFILQEPILFTGTVRENILYGNEKYMGYSNEELEKVLKQDNLEGLLSRFEQGLETKIASTGDGISLGQKQLIAFMRAVLRHPELLILDEATANIDTITEKMLEDILAKLPASTARVIIAHRLNTIQNADEIFFVNGGAVTRAGSFDHAVEMLLHGQRKS